MNKEVLQDNTVAATSSNGQRYYHGTRYYKDQRGGDDPLGHSNPAPYDMSTSNFTSPPIDYKLVLVDEGGNVTETTFDTSMDTYGLLPGAPNDRTWTDDDEYKLLGKLTSKLRDHQFNAAVFGAEARSSFDMITESATRLARAIRYVKRGDVTRAARALGARKPGKVRKDVGSNWLELQYGWLPILGDAHEAGKALGSILNKPQVKTIRSRQSRPVKGNVNPVFGGSSTGRVQKQVIAQLKEQYSPVASLGLLDPEIVAWELVPYSFVADWFLPIGDFLEYRSVMGRTNATFVVSTTTRYVIQGGSGGLIDDRGSRLILDGGPGYIKQAATMQRVIQNGYSVPLPSFQSPLDLSWKRCLSSIALVQQRFK